jgi:hypothetical protein
MFATPIEQSSAPAVSLATLRDLLAKGREAHPDLASRMDKAAHILVARSITPTGDDGRSYWVESETSTEPQFYLVVVTPHGAWPCTCRDFERRQSWCKHALAVALLRRCEEAAAPPAPIPFPTERYSDDVRFELTEEGIAFLDGLNGAPIA